MKNPFSKSVRGLSIIIVGGGKVGTTLVERLSKEEHDITIIDQKSEVVQKIARDYDVMGVTGNGGSYNVQLEAGIESADLFIAVTDSDELNLLCCTIAKKVGDCAAVARVRNPDYLGELGYLREQLGISLIINPEWETATEMSRLLRLPTALGINSFARGHVELVKFKVPKDNVLNNKPIYEMRDFKCDLLVCGVERDGEMIIPEGSTVLKELDNVSILATPVNIHRFFKQIGVDTHQAKNCMIIGGGKTSYYLAKQLADMNIDVKIIERDMARCEELSILLPKTLIIHGDGGDESLLKEEGIEDIDAFVPLTGLDEENILLTLFAKSCSDTKVITKINRSTFTSVIDSMDLGSIVYPRYLTTESIIRYVRAMQNSIGSNIETLYHIFDNRAEALEFKIDKESSVIGIPLMELKLKDELLVACIIRKGKITIPRGSDMIQGGDRVIVVTTHTGFKDIEDILK
ncbi:MAG: Trk system potassium transporter TrkA [Lachnospiraceae bacterium]|nr:Trk system potassium transporter TrkA [Lachnospiraceae bacterium]